MIQRTSIIQPPPKVSCAIALLATLTLSSCATTIKPPHQEIQSAEQAISQAEQARVADYASPELRTAREKLTEARAAMLQENLIVARRLAEQSRVEADLAVAKADVSKAQAINDDIKKGTESMQQEMLRNRGMQR